MRSVGRVHTGLKALPLNTPTIWPSTRSSVVRHNPLHPFYYYSSTAANGSILSGDEQNASQDSLSWTEPTIRRYDSEPLNIHDRSKCISDQKLKRWSLELSRRIRTKGSAGVRESWEALKTQDLQLPTSGSSARFVWTTLVEDTDLWEELFTHYLDLRRQNGQTYEPFYSLLVGKCLAISSDKALAWHRQFDKYNAIPTQGLRWMVKAATSNHGSLSTFEEIYANSSNAARCIYDSLMPTLLRKETWYAEAIRWHELLLKYRDLPGEVWSTAEMQGVENKRRFLGISLSSSPASLSAQVSESILRFFEQTEGMNTGSGRYSQDINLPFNRSDISKFVGSTLANSASKELSDEFCSRLFATRAFSLDAIIKGLALLNTKRIGPLALRELAIRASEPQVVVQKLEVLRSLGMTLKGSTFSKAVVKLATENRSDLLHSLLKSDQHPDVLEDRELQTQLLSQYIERGFWSDAHRTLFLLTMFHKAPVRKSWNLLLQHYVRTRSQKVSSLCQDMIRDKIGITSRSLDIIANCYLVRRGRGRGLPTDARYPDSYRKLLFLTDLWLQMSTDGISLNPQRWHEILRRYGMKLDFDRVRWLCLKLEELYNYDRVNGGLSGSSVTVSRINPRSSSTSRANFRRDLNTLFTPALQQAVVSWGFKGGMYKINQIYRKALAAKTRGELRIRSKWDDSMNFSSHVKGLNHVHFPNRTTLSSATIAMLPPERTFLQGLLLLQELGKRGVKINIGLIRRTVKERLWQLYSLNNSVRHINRQAFKSNPYKLEEMVWAIEQTWQGPTLFPQLYEAEESRHLLTDIGVASQIGSESRNFDVEVSQAVDTEEQSNGTPFLIQLQNQTGNHIMMSKQRNAANSRRLPFILKDLMECSLSENSEPHNVEERIAKRKSLHFMLFGKRPKSVAQIPEHLWAIWVDQWARKYEYPGMEERTVQEGWTRSEEALDTMKRDKQCYAHRTNQT